MTNPTDAFGNDIFGPTLQISAVPIPASILVLGGGIAALGLIASRRKPA